MVLAQLLQPHFRGRIIVDVTTKDALCNRTGLVGKVILACVFDGFDIAAYLAPALDQIGEGLCLPFGEGETLVWRDRTEITQRLYPVLAGVLIVRAGNPSACAA